MKKANSIIAASTAVAIALFLILGAAGGFASGAIGAWLVYYGHELSGSLAGFFYMSVLFLCLMLIVLVIWALGKSFIVKTSDPRKVFTATARRSREILLIAPVVFFVTIIALAMGEANEFARARLMDAMVAGWERALFGNYAFASLGAVHYPHWLVVFIIFSFENMSLILILAGIILAILVAPRFRELLIAFCIGILVMVPLWLIVPVLSPQDRFINDVYHLPNSPELALVVADYHPQPEISDFLATIRTGKAGLPALPTSTIPSAHIFWAVIAGYYLFRARRWLGWVALPFLVASSFGTVLLAQHYFMDIPAGIAVAALAIWLAHDVEEEIEKVSAEKQEAGAF